MMFNVPKEYKSLVIALIGSLGFVISAIGVLLVNLSQEFVPIPCFLSAFFILLNLVSIILGVFYIATKSIKLNPKNIIINTSAILLSVATVSFVVSLFTHGRPSLSKEIICSSRLMNIHRALCIYANENKDCCPTAEKWCDLLMQKTDVSKESFKCPNDKKGPSSFALNPNANLNSQSEMVLVFEARLGWNQNGGRELLNKENHKGKGASILYVSGYVEFVREEDLKKLNWGIKAKEPNRMRDIK
jgi:hypothetical protein